MARDIENSFFILDDNGVYEFYGNKQDEYFSLDMTIQRFRC